MIHCGTAFWTFDATGGFWLPSSSLVILRDEPVDDVQIDAFGLEVVSSRLDELRDAIDGMRKGTFGLDTDLSSSLSGGTSSFVFPVLSVFSFPHGTNDGFTNAFFFDATGTSSGLFCLTGALEAAAALVEPGLPAVSDEARTSTPLDFNSFSSELTSTSLVPIKLF